MTRDDIIKLAREAGLAPIYSACDEPDVSYAYEDWDEELEKFAALVAAAEREACAKVCEDLDLSQDSTWQAATLDCAVAIRARAQA
jgi:phosphoserine phosphatase